VNHSDAEPFGADDVFELERAGSPGVPAQVNTTVEPLMSNLIRILLAILLPPVGVFFTVGLGGQFWLNILLTIFGYIPGIVHAVWIIARRTR
jgi:uncharacterized membrane protein YqaE (UPF0057 family)